MFLLVFLKGLDVICKQLLFYKDFFTFSGQFKKYKPEWHHHLYQDPKKETLLADPTFSPTSPSSPFPVLNKQVIWFCFTIKKQIDFDFMEVLNRVWSVKAFQRFEFLIIYSFFVAEENQMTCTSWTSNPWKSNATNGIWKHICNDGWITIGQSKLFFR